MTAKYFKQIVTPTTICSIGFTLSDMTTPHPHIKFYSLFRSTALGAIAVLPAICCGIVPDLSAQPDRIFGVSARADERDSVQQGKRTPTSVRAKLLRRSSVAQAADEFSEPELRKYAAALMEIEPLRQSTLTQVIQANGGGTLPNLVCSDSKSMEALNNEAKTLFVKFCTQSEQIASSKGLTNDRFNHITQAVKSNPQLQNRVRGFMN